MHKLYVSNLKTHREGTGNIRSQDYKHADDKCHKNYVKHQENNVKRQAFRPSAPIIKI